MPYHWQVWSQVHLSISVGLKGQRFVQWVRVLRWRNESHLEQDKGISAELRRCVQKVLLALQEGDFLMEVDGVPVADDGALSAFQQHCHSSMC